MQAAEIRERLEGERATWRACVSPRSLWCLLSLPGSTALRLPAPKPRLFHAVLFLVTLLLAPLTAAQVISVPAGFYERPERVWVLPVVFTPADQTGAIPDPANPGFALDGTPVASATQRLWDAARANMIAQLRVTRAVYEDRLGDPSTGESRGTFGIASWNAATNAVEACSPSTLKPLPYVYVGSQSWAG